MISFENLEIIMKKKSVDNMIKEFNDYSEDKKVKLDNILNLLIDFNEFYIHQKVNKKNIYKF